MTNPKYANHLQILHEFLNNEPTELSFIPARQQKLITSKEARKRYPYLKSRMFVSTPDKLIEYFTWAEEARINGIRPFNSFIGLNQKEDGFKTHNITVMRNLLIDIDADTNHHNSNALKHIKPVSQAILNYFDCDMTDWKLTATSSFGNQILIPIKPIKITKKNIRGISASLEKFYKFMGGRLGNAGMFGDKKHHIYIDQGVSDVARVFRPAYTWNANKNERAYPISWDWERYEDKNIWKQIIEISEEINQ